MVQWSEHDVFTTPTWVRVPHRLRIFCRVFIFVRKVLCSFGLVTNTEPPGLKLESKVKIPPASSTASDKWGGFVVALTLRTQSPDFCGTKKPVGASFIRLLEQFHPQSSSNDSWLLVAWFYRRIHHGSHFPNPCLQLYECVHDRRHRCFWVLSESPRASISATQSQ